MNMTQNHFFLTLSCLLQIFSIIHERINLILLSRLLIRRVVIDCLAFIRNKSGSIQSFPSIRYCIANCLNADFDSFNWKNVSLLLYCFLILFLTIREHRYPPLVLAVCNPTTNSNNLLSFVCFSKEFLC